MTGIQWTNETWNPTTGCDRVSPGCDNCYALGMAKRLKGMGSAKYQTDGDPRTSGPGFGIAEHVDALDLPLRWRKPRKVFVNSMSDLFHDGVSDGFIGSVFDVMAKTPQHTYQILTKRHGRMRSLLNRWAAEGARHDWAGPGTAVFRRGDMAWVGPVAWPLPNVWLGVSVEDQQRANLRIPALLDTPAAVRFLSCEPLLGPVQLCGGCAPDAKCAMDGIGDIDWVIVGGESGPGARPMELAWVESLVAECQEGRKAVFVKQLGSVHGPGKGGDMELWPTGLQVREFPAAVTP
jgi:protein gp37